MGISKLKTPSHTPAHQSVDSLYTFFYRKNNDDGLLGPNHVAYWGGGSEDVVSQSVGFVFVSVTNLMHNFFIP